MQWITAKKANKYQNLAFSKITCLDLYQLYSVLIFSVIPGVDIIMGTCRQGLNCGIIEKISLTCNRERARVRLSVSGCVSLFLPQWIAFEGWEFCERNLRIWQFKFYLIFRFSIRSNHTLSCNTRSRIMENKLKELQLSIIRLEENTREMEHTMRMLLLTMMSQHLASCTRNQSTPLTQAQWSILNRKSKIVFH